MDVITNEDTKYEGLDPNPRILTPEIVSRENGPDRIYAHTSKYGETISTLKPGFESKVDKFEGTYEVDVPEEVLKVCKEIYGIGGRALLVGGSVRDAVISTEFPDMKLKPKDFDLEIYGVSPEQLQLILETTFGSEKLDAVGEAFEILKVKIDGWEEPLDFSIPRRDSKTGEGHRGFSVQGDPTMTIDEASLRRDLTINSVAYDPLTKTLYDAYGGVKDIKNGMIEVTDIATFQEDPLRVMRIMQFSARFGFEISERTRKLCKQMVERGDLDALPRERIAEEVKKLLTKGEKPSIGLEFAHEIGFIQRYWPELAALSGVPQEKDWHPEGDVWIHTLQVVDAAVEIANREIKSGKLSKEDKVVLVAAALCHDLGKPATTEFIEGSYRSRGHEPAGVIPTREFLERIFGNPNAREISKVTKKVLPLIAEHLKPKEFWENEVKRGIDQTNAIRRLAKRLSDGHRKTYADGGDSNIYMLSLLAEADQRGRNGEGTNFLQRDQVSELEDWQSWLLRRSTELKVEQKPLQMLLTGKLFLESSGHKKGGPWVGAVLRAVYEDQLDGKVTSLEEALASGNAYYETFSQKVQNESEHRKLPAITVWENIVRLEDPRTYLTS
jgi:tRNA nucleotidyltransferase (CCA-adding enzyme)